MFLYMYEIPLYSRCVDTLHHVTQLTNGWDTVKQARPTLR